MAEEAVGNKINQKKGLVFSLENEIVTKPIR